MAPAQPIIETFHNDGNKLVGYLYKPKGDGPFPAVVWNHGSEKDANLSQTGPWQRLADVFVPAGYVLFGPQRRGQGGSEGQYIEDVKDKEKKLRGKEAAQRLWVRLMGSQQLEDQLAGLEHLKKLSYINRHRIAVGGCSYGGIETMLAAERGAGYKAAIPVSPAAETWEGDQFIRRRLLKAAKNAKIPVLLIHPHKDVSLNPGYRLGEEFEKHHKPYGLFIFPPYGKDKEQHHCFGGLQGGPDIWGPSMLRFLQEFMK